MGKAADSPAFIPDTNHFFSDRTQLEEQIARLLGEFSRAHRAVSGLEPSLFRRVSTQSVVQEYVVQVQPYGAADPTLGRDLRALGDRLSTLVNDFAQRHPGFEPTELTADYVDRPDRDREYLVELSVKL